MNYKELEKRLKIVIEGFFEWHELPKPDIMAKELAEEITTFMISEAELY
jgi:hypothetical protein